MIRRLAGFAVGIVVLAGCQGGWGATAEKSAGDRDRHDRTEATATADCELTTAAPCEPGASAPDPG